MRVVAQRVKSASIKVDTRFVSSIAEGLLIYLGIMKNDTEKDLDYLVKKILNLRIFNDENNKMNKSVLEKKDQILVVSQFTICANTQKGHRPSFDNAADPKIALEYYNRFCSELEKSDIEIRKGVFAADMKVESINDGPVTILIDSCKIF